MVHYGHSNQLRQAKAMGDYLIVGVHTDSETPTCPPPPLLAPRLSPDVGVSRFSKVRSRSTRVRRSSRGKRGTRWCGPSSGWTRWWKGPPTSPRWGRWTSMTVTSACTEVNQPPRWLLVQFTTDALIEVVLPTLCLDDITLTVDGKDTYEEVKKSGRYR